MIMENTYLNVKDGTKAGLRGKCVGINKRILNKGRLNIHLT